MRVWRCRKTVEGCGVDVVVIALAPVVVYEVERVHSAWGAVTLPKPLVFGR